MGFKMDLPADQSRILMSKGIHVAKCVKVESKDSSNNNPMLVFRYESLSPGEEGRTVFDNVVITPQMAWRYSKVFAAYGLQPKGAKGFVGVSEKSFEGKKVRLVIEHEDYKGEPQARVREVLPLGDGKAALQQAEPAVSSDDDEPQNVADLDVDNGDDGSPEDDLPF